MSWILASRDLEATVCLRFIDPYGDTIFNLGQLPVLLAELESTRTTLTIECLESAKQRYLTHARSWPGGAFKDAQRHSASVSLGQLHDHFERLVSLLRHALDRGPHHFVRFVGD